MHVRLIPIPEATKPSLLFQSQMRCFYDPPVSSVLLIGLVTSFFSPANGVQYYGTWLVGDSHLRLVPFAMHPTGRVQRGYEGLQSTGREVIPLSPILPDI